MKNLDKRKTTVSLVQYFSNISKTALFSREEEKNIFQLLERQEDAYLAHLIGMSEISIPILISYSDKFSRSQREDKQAALKPINRLIKLLKIREIEKASKFYVKESRKHSLIRDIQSDLYSAVLETEFKNGGVDWVNQLFELRNPYIKTKNIIVKHNLRLVVSLVYKINIAGLIPDLIQEGNIGLMRAVEKFDWRNEVRFSTYACWWIRQSIRRYLADKMKIIRNPIHISEKIYNLERLEEKYYARTGEQISIEELAEIADITPDKVVLLQKTREMGISSLDTPINDDGVATLIDVLKNSKAEQPDAQLKEKEIKETVDILMVGLTQREKHIIQSRFGVKEFTLQELGDMYGLSRERIRQIEHQAMGRMRKLVKNNPKMLKFYSDNIGDGRKSSSQPSC
jgi:RNA polymerase sigma factor (sigma-70 family)